MSRATRTIELPGHTQHAYYFDNGYGASVIRTPDSYGSRLGLWELAVLKKGADEKWSFCYYTPITKDVIGWLSEEAVDILLAEIESWPKEGEK